MKKHSMKNSIALLLCAVMMLAVFPLPASAGTGYEWQSCPLNAISAGDTVAITANCGGSLYLLPSAGSSSAPTAIAATVQNGCMVPSEADADYFAWHLSWVGNGYSIVNNAGAYLSVDFSGSDVRVDGSDTLWTVSGNCLSASDGVSTRYLGVSTESGCWRSYEYNSDISGQSISFWKLTEKQSGSGSGESGEGLAAPTASPEAGLVSAGSVVTLQAADGLTIYYQIAGGEYIEYTGPITVTEEMTITAYAQGQNGRSAPVSFHYTVGDTEKKANKVTTATTLRLTDTALLYNASAGTILSDSAAGGSGAYPGLQGSPVSFNGQKMIYHTDAVPAPAELTAVWQNNGEFSLKTKEGRFLSMNADGVKFVNGENDETVFRLEEKGSGDYYIKSSRLTVGTDKLPIYLANVSGQFSALTLSGGKTEAMLFTFYIQSDGEISISGPDKYRPGETYPGTITVTDTSALKYVSATVYVNGTATDVKLGQKDEKAYIFEIPADVLSPGSLPTDFYLDVSVTNAKNNHYRGGKTVPVVDEPYLSDTTPADGSKTGKETRPLISFALRNAGEEPTLVLTMNGAVIPRESYRYNEEKQLYQYQAQSEMEPGRYTMALTITRKDEKKSFTSSWSFTVGEGGYQPYFGQLHAHTGEYSDGIGTLSEALEYIGGLKPSDQVDFVAITDHAQYFDTGSENNSLSSLYNMANADAGSQARWAAYNKAINDFNASHPGVVAIAGFEMSWDGGEGHINTFNTAGVVSTYNPALASASGDAGLRAYYQLLSQAEGAGSISQFNHPGDAYGNFSDFDYYSKTLDERVFLLEVGCGQDNPIDSYEQYIMALDKGWHLAPTVNQDNHKGKWGNANESRDVILAEGLTQQSLFAAIRSYRVYATEDRNLSLYYTLNGNVMGSILKRVPTENLQISLLLSDPDTIDRIAKAELISNGGEVLYSWNNDTELNSGSLSCSVEPKAGYYFLRVTEADGDVAITAPVWVGESVRAGISSVKADTTSPATGKEVRLTTTLFNNESYGVTLKSLTYAKGSTVLSTDSTQRALAAGATMQVEYGYTPLEAGDQTLTATAVLLCGGVEHSVTKTLSLEVLDSNALVYLGIDASHYNEYVSGNYRDSIKTFRSLAAEYGVCVVELETGKDLIEACANVQFKALVFTAPSRRLRMEDGSAAAAVYAKEELEAISAFQKRGGTVIVTGWADSFENYSYVDASTPHMAETQNALLAALGTSLRLSDDTVSDKEHNGGSAEKLLVANFNSDSNLMNGVITEKGHTADYAADNLYTEFFCLYRGCSLYAVDSKGNVMDALEISVAPAVYANATGTAVDTDKDGKMVDRKYAYATDDDRLLLLASDKKSGQGRVIVCGSCFLSDFEIGPLHTANAEKGYANTKVCENILNSISPYGVTTIAAVKGRSAVGERFSIQGVVTSNSSAYDRETSFTDGIYLQDETGGILCTGIKGGYKEGDRLRLIGTTADKQGERILKVTKTEPLGTGKLVTPAVVSAESVNKKTVTGNLVTISGIIRDVRTVAGLPYTVMVEDEAGNQVRTLIGNNITPSVSIEELSEGHQIVVTGVAYYDSNFNAPNGPFAGIRVRNRADVVCNDLSIHSHSYTWTVEKEADCTTDGCRTGVCQCGDVKSEVLPALGHEWSEWAVVKRATSATMGTKERSCALCGKTERVAIPAGENGSGVGKVVLWVLLVLLLGAGGWAALFLMKNKRFWLPDWKLFRPAGAVGVGRISRRSRIRFFQPRTAGKH